MALLGGTFDPVHYGHLRFADTVRRTLGLRTLRLVPARDPPHRSAARAHRPPTARPCCALAVAEFPGLVVDRRELERAGKSYTVLTLEELRREDPGRPLLLLLGADAFLGLPTWHRWHEIFALAHVVVVARPGVRLADGLPAALVPEWDARATPDPGRLVFDAGRRHLRGVRPAAARSPRPTIRDALAAGPADRGKIAQLMPRAVLAYIDQHGLYTTPPDAT